MDRKQKTAAVSTLLNLLLTLAKFILAAASGSLVILADAWHSLTDVATSILVLISVSPRCCRKKAPGTAAGTGEGSRIAWKNIPLEKWISLIIGALILFAAAGVVHRTVYAPARDIPSPFLYGAFFLAFAALSRVVSVFEIKVGREENSPALIADGLHSRADMVTSLVAGGSLIALQLGLNQLGVNFDRIGAGIVVVFLLSFSLETLVNFWYSLRGRTGWKDRVAVGLLAEGLAPQNWTRFLALLSRLGNRCGLSEQYRSWLRRGVVGLAAAGVALFVFLNCLTIIGPSEEGIRERMGRVVNRGAPLGSGLHFHLPPPLEKIHRIDTRTIRRMEIGNIADPGAAALLWTRKHGTEDAFLSAENYFFHPYLAIHYRVGDIFDYRYSSQRPEDLLENAANRVLTRIFSSRVFIDIVTGYRDDLERTVRDEVQADLDHLGAGLEVITVNTKDIHPPVEVADSYEQVIAAMQAKEERINRALGYRHSSIPEARGRADRTVREAEAYVVVTRQRAAGEAGRFIARSDSISAHPPIVKPMLYREAVKEALADRPLVLVDPAVSGTELWIKSGRPLFFEEEF